MTNQPGTSNAKVLPASVTQKLLGAVGGISNADALGALTQLVDATRQSIQIHEAESTKREKLRTYRETEVARIEASAAILRDYFDRVFAERAETNRNLFESLRRAIETDDNAALQTVVGGIVAVAQTSPLANFGDLGELRRAMDDPSTVFEF